VASEELDLLMTFAILLIAAEVGSLLFRALRLPRVVGMLGAGVLIGPNVNRYADAMNIHPEAITDLAFLGGLFLMFSIGLSFNVHNFKRIARRALFLSIAGSLMAFLGAFLVALVFHRSVNEAMFLALILTPTTSVVAFRIAQEQNLLATRGMDTTIGSILLDDVTIIFFGTIVLALATRSADIDWSFTFLSVILIVLLGTVIVMVGLRLLPRTLDIFERLSHGSPTLLAVSLAFLVSYVFTLIELPPIFGAFWAGSIIASSRFGDQVQTFIRPITELFSALFFTAIGMLVNPGGIWAVALLTGALIVVASITRFGAGYGSLRALRTPVVPALACATLLVPRGELTLVLAQYAGDPGLVAQLQLIGSVVVAATTLLGPLLLHLIRWWATRPRGEPVEVNMTTS
jgi:monovalent cation:H+ antiporter-2, CPA2 family